MDATSTPDHALQDRLVQVSFAVMAILQRTAAAHDLSVTTVRILAILRDRTLPMAALADHLGQERSSVSGLIDRATARGLVERVRDDADGRVVRVSLTDEGRSLAATGAREIGVAVATLTAGLGAKDQAQLARLLGAVVPASDRPARSAS